MNLDKIKKELENWPATLKKYQVPNTRKAVFQIITTFGPFLALWVLMYFSLRVSYLLTLGLGLINGFFMIKIFIIQHDCGHKSFMKSKAWMNSLGFICSLFCSIPYKYWAKSHDYHHNHNGQLDQRDVGDIKTFTVRQFKAMSKLRRLRYRIFRMPVVLFGLGTMFYLMIHNRIPIVRLKSFKKYERSLWLNNLAIALVYIALMLVLGWKQFLLVHLTTLALFGVISVWFFYVQHQHDHTYKHYKEKWEYLLAAVRGSSFYNIHPLFHWLTGHIGYHHIHHLNPRIPNYNLKWCAIENPSFTKYATSLTFVESLGTMRNKLWDEERNKMISFREFYRRYD